MRRIALLLAIGFLVFWAGARFLPVADFIRGYSDLCGGFACLMFLFWVYSNPRPPRTPDGPGRVTR